MASIEREKEVVIGPLNDHHDFLRDNEFIHTGYRLNFSSTKRILKSLFMIHNESVNVWSHLFGAILFLVLVIYTLYWIGFSDESHHEAGQMLYDLKTSALNAYKSSVDAFDTFSEKAHIFAHDYENSLEQKLLALYVDAHHYSESIELRVHNFYEEFKHSNETEKFKPVMEKIEIMLQTVDSKKYDWMDIYNPFNGPRLQVVHRWPVLVFLVSASVCLGCSTLYHLFKAHSLTLNLFYSRLDYAGISFLIAGSCFPAFYYTFYCREGKSYLAFIWIYLVGISIAATFTFVMSLTPQFQRVDLIWLRGLAFILLSSLGAIPAVHFLLLPEAEKFYSCFVYFIVVVLLYVCGVCVYIMRFPERYFPGKFDFWGNSHNLWHFFVLSAAFFHYLGALDSYHRRERLLCSA